MQTCNINQTHVDEYDPWSGILATEAFSNSSAKYIMKCYSLVQLIFGRDIIPTIKHTVDSPEFDWGRISPSSTRKVKGRTLKF